MNKVVEYLIVSAVSGFLFLLMAVWVTTANINALRKDCNAMGQSRIGDLHIKCEVVPSRDEVAA